MSVDWADGDYGRFAQALEPAAREVLAAVGAGPGMRLIDVGCGTGNAALLAAAMGAAVRAVDPAPALLDELARRAATLGLVAERACVAAEELPESDFDAAISVFSVIFAGDPGAAVRGLVRSVRIGGRVALTSWRGDGAVAAIAAIIRQELPVPDGARTPAWEDGGWVRALLLGSGARDVTVTEHEIVHHGSSPVAWLAEIERFHPFWRWVRREVTPTVWRRIHERSIGVLDDANEEPDGFAARAGYMLVRATRAT